MELRVIMTQEFIQIYCINKIYIINKQIMLPTPRSSISCTNKWTTDDMYVCDMRVSLKTTYFLYITIIMTHGDRVRVGEETF